MNRRSGSDVKEAGGEGLCELRDLTDGRETAKRLPRERDQWMSYCSSTMTALGAVLCSFLASRAISPSGV